MSLKKNRFFIAIAIYFIFTQFTQAVTFFGEGTVSGDPDLILFNNDGTKMFVSDASQNTNGTVKEYLLSTAYDVTTATLNATSTVSIQGYGANFNNDGTKLYFPYALTNIRTLTLTTAFDITTLSSPTDVSFSGDIVVARGLTFNSDGSSVYIHDAQVDKAYQYNLSTPFDISTKGAKVATLDYGNDGIGAAYNLQFNNTGTKLFIQDMYPDVLYSYTLTTAYDISTATIDPDSFNYSITDSRAFRIADNGTKLYLGYWYTADKVQQYTLSPAYSLGDSTAPSITSSNAASVAENQTTAIDVNATDGSTITYSLVSSGDSSLFSINSSTGVITFNAAPDYEIPTDSDSNNTYIFTVRATDTSGNYSSQNITITVTDVDENSPTGALAYTISSTTVTKVKQSDVVRITATLSEALADSPVLQIAGSGVATLSATNMTKSTTTSYYYDWTVPAGDGTQTFALSTGEDTTGNVITATPTSGASITVDNTAPTITGTTISSDNSTIAVTFSEAVYNAIGGSGSLQASDFSLSITGGTATLASATPTSISASGNVFTLGVSLSGDAAGTETITVVPSSSTAIYDAASNAASTTQSNNSVTLNSSSLPTPLEKKDVTASISAWSNTAAKWSSNIQRAVDGRFRWLSNHQNSKKTSYQGIKFDFGDSSINAVMNNKPKARSSASSYFDKYQGMITSNPVGLLNNTKSTLVAFNNSVESDSENFALNEMARAREETIGSLNPEFEPVFGDWSLWTSGEIGLTEIGATSTSSKEDTKDIAITIGFDKPYDNDGLIGWSLSIGQSKTEIGTSTTEIKSDNYALSGYRLFTQENGNQIEGIVGIGHIKFDTTRVDGSDTLSGERDANQIFASIRLKNEKVTFKKDNWSATPYGKLSLSHTELEKFSETGGTTALTYLKQRTNETKLSLGVDTTYTIQTGKTSLNSFANFEYGRDVAGGSSATMHYNSETDLYTFNLDKAFDEYFKLGFGLEVATKDGWQNSFGYEREQSTSNGHSDRLKVDLRLRF